MPAQSKQQNGGQVIQSTILNFPWEHPGFAALTLNPSPNQGNRVYKDLGHQIWEPTPNLSQEGKPGTHL
ncbi:hypothetical protein [Egbenema bharatensis]|uniref:hypothetical protein n=1 Tax=Egbenema bharatensis TaxID=3463334 RepID=UPI003A88EC7A